VRFTITATDNGLPPLGAARAFEVQVQPRPQLRIAPTNDLLWLGWNSATGRVYRLQSATNLPPANWLNEGAPFTGTGGMLGTNLPIGREPSKFLRLRTDN
jgi:hypothetical protein